MPSHIPDEFVPPSTALITKSGRYYPLEDANAQAPASPPPPSLRDFFDILRRRKTIAINAFLLVVALGTLVTLMTKPVWNTSARLLVEGKSNTLAINNSNDPMGAALTPKSGHEVDTQIEILRSSMVLKQVYEETKVPPGAVNLAVRRVAQTDVIELSFTSNSRPFVERFARQLPKIYERQTRDDRLREVSAALSFAQKSLTEQNAKLTRTEKAFADFKNQKGVVDATIEVPAAIEANAQVRRDLVAAESEADKLQSTLQSLTAQRAGMAAFVVTPLTTTNPAIIALRTQIADLNSQRASLLFLYKASDDRVRQIDGQIRELKARLASTPETVTNTSRAPNPAVAEVDAKISDTRTAIQAAARVVAPLRARVAAQGVHLGGYTDIQRRLAQLQRDLDSSSSASKTLGESVLQLTLRKKALEAAGAPVMTMEASGPPVQIAPRLGRGILMAMLLGLLVACGAALLQDSLDDHLRDENEARQLLDTSILGYFPMWGNSKTRPILNLENPDRHLLESFRVLRSNVQFTLVSKGDKRGTKLLITSSVPAEGKSYVASNLAIAMALDGRRVILVDTDLHRPRQHEIFGAGRYPGITDVLVGNAKLRDCVQEVGIPNLRFIAAGVTPPNPAELLNSAVMDVVIDRLSQGADLVIFDSPPMLATADSQVLSAKMDGVVYVMQLGRVPRSAVKRSFELLQQAGAHVIGIVFNKVERQQNKAYSSYSGYYYSDYSDDVEEGENGENGSLPSGGKDKAATSFLSGVSKMTKGRSPHDSQRGATTTATAGRNGNSSNGNSSPNGSSNGASSLHDDDDDDHQSGSGTAI